MALETLPQNNLIAFSGKAPGTRVLASLYFVFAFTNKGALRVAYQRKYTIRHSEL